MIGLLAITQEQGVTASWGNQQNVHPMGLLMLLLAGATLVMVRREYMVYPVIFIAMFVTTAQRIVVAGLDFPFLRILIFLGIFRVVLMGEARGFKLVAVDKVILLWGASSYITDVLREGLFVYGLGWLVDNLGAYFLCRLMLRNREDLYQMAKCTALLAIPVMLVFLYEKATHYNLFSVFGGVNAVTFVREGRLRCLGPFQHPILAGCYFAGLMPMLAVLWVGTDRSPRKRLLCAAGVIAAVVVVICCSSSTPAMAVAAGLGGLALYKVHRLVPFLRWGSVVALFVLHFFVMKAPVWHLISRIDIAGGSTGYHRFVLIDTTIRRFHEWAVMGVASTWHWGQQMFDITGHYVLQCTEGGLPTFLLFIALLGTAFKCVARTMKNSPDRRDHWFAWAVGAGLFANCVSFIGVSYFGKPLFLLMMQLGVLASMEYATRGARVFSRDLAEPELEFAEDPPNEPQPTAALPLP